MCRIEDQASNNQAEYEALIIGLDIQAAIKAHYVEVKEGSQLVIKQITGKYKC